MSDVIFMLYDVKLFFFFFNDTATTEIYTLSLHDALPISFEPLHEALTGEPTLVDTTLDELTRELIAQPPDVVAVTAPFPGNVYGAFRMARTIRAAAPNATLILGGGWVNTELRSLRDPRIFDYFDYVTLDDGERPLLSLLTRLGGRSTALVRTYLRR